MRRTAVSLILPGGGNLYRREHILERAQLYAFCLLLAFLFVCERQSYVALPIVVESKLGRIVAVERE